MIYEFECVERHVEPQKVERRENKSEQNYSFAIKISQQSLFGGESSQLIQSSALNESSDVKHLIVSLPQNIDPTKQYHIEAYLSYDPTVCQLELIVKQIQNLKVDYFNSKPQQVVARFLTVASLDADSKEYWFDLLTVPEPVCNYPLLIWSPRPQSGVFIIANLQLNRPQVYFHVQNRNITSFSSFLNVPDFNTWTRRTKLQCPYSYLTITRGKKTFWFTSLEVECFTTRDCGFGDQTESIDLQDRGGDLQISLTQNFDFFNEPQSEILPVDYQNWRQYETKLKRARHCVDYCPNPESIVPSISFIVKIDSWFGVKSDWFVVSGQRLYIVKKDSTVEGLSESTNEEYPITGKFYCISQSCLFYVSEKENTTSVVGKYEKDQVLNSFIAQTFSDLKVVAMEVNDDDQLLILTSDYKLKILEWEDKLKFKIRENSYHYPDVTNTIREQLSQSEILHFDIRAVYFKSTRTNYEKEKSREYDKNGVCQISYEQVVTLYRYLFESQITEHFGTDSRYSLFANDTIVAISAVTNTALLQITRINQEGHKYKHIVQGFSSREQTIMSNFIQRDARMDLKILPSNNIACYCNGDLVLGFCTVTKMLAFSFSRFQVKLLHGGSVIKTDKHSYYLKSELSTGKESQWLTMEKTPTELLTKLYGVFKLGAEDKSLGFDPKLVELTSCVAQYYAGTIELIHFLDPQKMISLYPNGASKDTQAENSLGKAVAWDLSSKPEILSFPDAQQTQLLKDWNIQSIGFIIGDPTFELYSLQNQNNEPLNVIASAHFTVWISGTKIKFFCKKQPVQKSLSKSQRSQQKQDLMKIQKIDIDDFDIGESCSIQFVTGGDLQFFMANGGLARKNVLKITTNSLVIAWDLEQNEQIDHLFDTKSFQVTQDWFNNLGQKSQDCSVFTKRKDKFCTKFTEVKQVNIQDDLQLKRNQTKKLNEAKKKQAANQAYGGRYGFSRQNLWEKKMEERGLGINFDKKQPYCFQPNRYFSRLDLEIFIKMQSEPKKAAKYFEIPLLFSNFGAMTVLSYFKDAIHSSLMISMVTKVKNKISQDEANMYYPGYPALQDDLFNQLTMPCYEGENSAPVSELDTYFQFGEVKEQYKLDQLPSLLHQTIESKDSSSFRQALQLLLLSERFSLSSVVSNYSQFQAILSINREETAELLSKASHKTKATSQELAIRSKVSQSRLSFTSNTPFLNTDRIVRQFDKEVVKLTGFSLFISELFQFSIKNQLKVQKTNLFFGKLFALLQDQEYNKDLNLQLYDLQIIDIEWLEDRVPNFLEVVTQQEFNFDNPFVLSLLGELDYWYPSFIFIFMPFFLYFGLVTYYNCFVLSELSQPRDGFFKGNSFNIVIRILIVALTFYQYVLEYLQMRSEGARRYFQITRVGKYLHNFMLLFNIWVILEHTTNFTHVNSIRLSQAASIGQFQLWWYFLDWMRLFDGTAVYVKLIQDTVYNTRFFMVMLLIIMATFGSMQLILDSQARNIAATKDGSEYIPVNTPIMDTDVTDSMIYQYFVMYGTSTQEGYRGNPSSNLLWIYYFLSIFLTNVTFLNLLIAVMSTTFETVMETKERGMIIARTRIYYEYIGALNFIYPYIQHKFNSRYMYIAKIRVEEQSVENTITSFKRDIRNETQSQAKKLVILEDLLHKYQAENRERFAQTQAVLDRTIGMVKQQQESQQKHRQQTLKIAESVDKNTQTLVKILKKLKSE